MTGLNAAPSPEDAARERDRKAEHIALALSPRNQLERSFFDDWAFDHVALPEIDMDAISLATSFLGRRLQVPLLVSCMTGGTEEATRINRHLAIAAERTGVAIGVGSQRKALEDPRLAASFQIRDLAPSVPLLANLGAVQLNYGYGIDECRRAVEMIGADALVLHVNPLQEAIQPEGDRDFSGLLPRIGRIVEQLEVPVIVKEIGCGLSGRVGRALRDQGVTIVDSAGLGGTSWARIEAARARDREVGEMFADWGIPTPRSIIELAAIGGLTVIGSGGVRNGVDAAKAMALGADLVGSAQLYLEPATRSADAAAAAIETVARQLRIAMFCVGAPDLEALRGTDLRERSNR
jgi:isopentenyl-diphosphate delta-isomerase